MFKKFKSVLAILPAILLGVFTATTLSNTYDTAAQAYSSSSLPSTIDLNDTSEADIRDYYSSLNDLSINERQGENLLKNLKPILKKNQRYYSYESGTAIWQIYEIADRDWEKSPADEIDGYNATTNIITGYSYGSSVSNNKGTNPYVHALYVNRNVDNQVRAWDDHNQTQWGINREHIWPKSQGFEAEGAGGARGDPMHLWPGNGRVNGTEHNNNFYGFVDTSQEYTDPVTAKGYTNLAGNMSGVSLTLGNGKVFEPQDSDKGDIARAVFYMVARYNFLSGSDSDGIDQNNPNLELVQSNTVLTSYTSTETNTGKLGILSDLLEWNRMDPPDEFEIHRNNLLYNNYTYNRNPFIDFPEWAEYIWGSATYENNELISYDSTPTGYASPNTDPINGISTEDPQELSIEGTYDTTVPFGSTFDKSGIKVYLSNSSEQTKIDVTSAATISEIDTTKLGNQELNISYGTLKTSVTIKVTNVGSQDYVGQTKATPLSDLIFSAYIEGSGNNKALEIFNGTGNSIDLSPYSVKLFSNGKTSPDNTLSLSGTILNNETLVIVHSSSNTVLKSYANIESSVCNFNGNDTVILYKNDTIIDQFGDNPTGTSPSDFTGKDANGANVSAKDYSLLRIPNLNIVGKSNNFTFSEWFGYSTDTFDILKTYKIEETIEVSAEQQAEAYANYFLESTQENCNQLIIQSTDTWNDLKTEYEAMIEDSKSLFVSSDENMAIADARARYLFIVNKYQTLEDFIKIGNQNRNLFANFVASGEIMWTIVPILVLTIGGVVLAAYISKEKAQK